MSHGAATPNVVLYDANGDPVVFGNDLANASAELTRIRRMAEDAALAMTGAANTSLAPAKGQAAMRQSLPVAIASDQAPVKVLGASQVSQGNSSIAGIPQTIPFTGEWEDVSNFDSVRVNFIGAISVLAGAGQIARLEIQWADTPGREPAYQGFNSAQNPYLYREVFTVINNTLLSVERSIIATYFRVIVTPAGITTVGIGNSFSNSVVGEQYRDGTDTTGVSLRTVYSAKPPNTRAMLGAPIPRIVALPQHNESDVDGYAGSSGSPDGGAMAVDNTVRTPKYGGAFSATGYLTSVVAAATAANTLLMSAKVTTSNTALANVVKVAFITRIRIRYSVVTAFAAAAVPAALTLLRHTGTTPTGGTSRTPCLKDDRVPSLNTVPPIAALDDVRDLNAALTGAPTFGTIVDSFIAPAFTVAGSYADWVCEWDAFGNDPLRLANGNGIALRVGTGAFPATGTWVFSYTIDWLELVF